MTAPSPERQFDGRPELRRFVHERLGFIRAHAEVAQIEAETGQDVELAHAMRRLVAQAKAAASVCNMLTAENRRLEEIGHAEAP